MEAIPPTDAQAALKLAAKSDVIIAAMGENRYLCGETKDRADVRLPGEQEKFVQQLIATGKPVILVVFGGRPMVLTDVAAGCRAIVYAWYPGQDGGHAVADLLLGRINPSGKLTITLPRSNEQIPISYRAGYSEKDMPLYPFGYGLSYTTYAYSKLQAPATAKTTDAEIPVQFQLTNTGAREGVEISQLYFAPVTPAPGQRPIELKGYGRVDLKPNETKTVTITVSPQQFARHNDAGTLTIDPENYQILVGASSTDIRLRANLDLTGDKVTLPHRDQFFSRTTVQYLREAVEDAPGPCGLHRRLLMNVSGSWQLGSPLPTPMILPAPSMAKLILFCATGTMRPCASVHGNGEHADVLAVGVDGRAVGRVEDALRVAGGFHFGFGDDLAVGVITFRAQSSRRVFHLPRQVANSASSSVCRATLAVQEQFHLLAIAEALPRGFPGLPCPASSSAATDAARCSSSTTIGNNKNCPSENRRCRGCRNAN